MVHGHVFEIKEADKVGSHGHVFEIKHGHVFEIKEADKVGSRGLRVVVVLRLG